MVRQVISIHTGQAGVRSGAAFWELLLDEQGFTNEGFLRSPGFGGPLGAPLGAPIGDFIWDSPLQRASLGGPWGPLGGMGGPPGAPEAAERVQNAADCFFAETEAGRRVPRCALLDLDSEGQDTLKRSSLGCLFSPQCMVAGKEDGGCLFPRGRRLGSSDPVRSQAQDVLRRQLEASDTPGGVLCMRSLGGGAGSGFGEEILRFVSEEAPKVPLLEVLLWPATSCASPVASYAASRAASRAASCLEPYNALLSLDGVADRKGGALLIDNAALSGLFSRAVSSRAPFTADLNHIIAQALASATLSLRFPSAATCGLEGLLNNSIPLPALSFLSVSYAPLISKSLLPFYKATTKDITLEAFKQRQSLFSALQAEGMFLTANLLYRGAVSGGEVQEALLAVKESKETAFVDWIPTGFKASLSPQGPTTPANGPLGATNKACCLLANHTANAIHINRTVQDAQKMLAKRAFVFRYVGEGLEEGEFSEALETAKSLGEAYAEAEVVYEYYYPDEEETETEDSVQAASPKSSRSKISSSSTVAPDNLSPKSDVFASSPEGLVDTSNSPGLGSISEPLRSP